MKILAITQARIGSSRFPEKILKTINGTSLLETHLSRILKSKRISKLIVATTIEPDAHKIVTIAEKIGVEVYRGSVNNVLERFYNAAFPYKPDLIVRLTSDCPLIDADLIDQVIDFAEEKDMDYVSNALLPTFPDGQDIEVFKFSALEKAYQMAHLKSDIEHVTPYIWRNSTYKNGNLFKSDCFLNGIDLSDIRITVDTNDDFIVIEKLVNELGSDKPWMDYVNLLNTKPEIKEFNKQYQRNEGYMKTLKNDFSVNTEITNFTISDKLCTRANEIIPGGSHTYSKGADQSPQLGPKFIERGLGSHVWDVDGNEYIDWAFGLTSVSLGHAYEPVLEAVRKELLKGSNFQCPSPIEVELAELFLKAVPSAEMVKFAKNGSTVTTGAVKLARAHTGRKLVAYCSDHGFFSYDDWYIGKKPNNSGVPDEFTNLSLTFKYNDIDSVEELFQKYPDQIACLILEPMEFDYPVDNYLHKVKDICHKNGALFILDEMITGFKLDFPGAHSMLNIEADLTTWGKGVGNGFSTCMLAGKKEIMELGGIKHDRERVFLISTTHGAETHALAAAIATINAIKSENAIERNIQLGTKLTDELDILIKRYELSEIITMKGHPNWKLMQFRDADKNFNDGFRTLLLQELVKDGILFRGYFQPTISHSQVDVEKTIYAFEKAFQVYQKALNSKNGYKDFLIGEPIKPVFRKYN
jgi:glutamate-1-semialdehyde aminotransferase/spore coat polysaccharide biosynthesis protein SpsF (cytidylyltransferase family)